MLPLTAAGGCRSLGGRAGGRASADYEEAEQLYTELQEREPKRLEHMDVLSNILYVRDNAERLSQLAHHALEVDRFRPETCCIIGEPAAPRPAR